LPSNRRTSGAGYTRRLHRRRAFRSAPRLYRAVRDLVLGVRMLDGKGSDLRFGGRVMKNVAGYDLSR